MEEKKENCDRIFMSCQLALHLPSSCSIHHNRIFSYFFHVHIFFFFFFVVAQRRQCTHFQVSLCRLLCQIIYFFICTFRYHSFHSDERHA